MTTLPTSLVARRLARELPKSMRTLLKDDRGYPVPYIVLIDKTGRPQFTINDHEKVLTCISKKLCSICGKRITGGFWFVGGSRCFLHEHGAFLDPPLHLECAEYALAVCPFLAARRYTDRLDDRLLGTNLPENMALVKADYMPPNLPERFGLGHADTFSSRRGEGQVVIFPGTWNYLEFWRSGTRCPAPDTGQPAPTPT